MVRQLAHRDREQTVESIRLKGDPEVIECPSQLHLEPAIGLRAYENGWRYFKNRLLRVVEDFRWNL